jgi:hypothetical protein
MLVLVLSVLTSGSARATTDWSGDGKADILAIDQSGYLRMYRGNGAGAWATGQAEYIGAGWGSLTQVFQAGDFSGDGKPDILAVDPSGYLRMYRGNGAGAWVTGQADYIGAFWNIYTRVIGPGDWDGDLKPDLLGIKSNGDVYLYRGNGSGGWITGQGELIASGMDFGTSVVTAGDFSGDHRPDLLVQRANGDLDMYRGGCQSKFLTGSPESIGHFWNFPGIAAPGDFSGDGKPDVLAVTSAGQLLMYRGNGMGAWVTGQGELIGGAGWGTLRVLSGPAAIGTRPHATSERFGGANCVIDRGDEIAGLIEAMAATDASGRQALWAGLDGTSRQYYVDNLIDGAMANRAAYGMANDESTVRAIFDNPANQKTLEQYDAPMTPTEEAAFGEGGFAYTTSSLSDQPATVANQDYSDDGYADAGAPVDDATGGFGCDPAETAGCDDAGISGDDHGVLGADDIASQPTGTSSAMDDLLSDKSGSSTSWFNRSGAVSDANAHALSARDGLYGRIGDNDCTNFVSQAWFFGGGLHMTKNWRIWHSFHPNFSVHDWRRKWTASWAAVRNFVDYMANSRQIVRLSSVDPTAMHIPDVGLGDAVEYDWGEGAGWSHLAIVVRTGGTNVDDLVDQHDTDRRRSSWRLGWWNQTDPQIRARMHSRLVHVTVR